MADQLLGVDGTHQQRSEGLRQRIELNQDRQDRLERPHRDGREAAARAVHRARPADGPAQRPVDLRRRSRWRAEPRRTAADRCAGRGAARRAPDPPAPPAGNPGACCISAATDARPTLPAATQVDARAGRYPGKPATITSPPMFATASTPSLHGRAPTSRSASRPASSTASPHQLVLMLFDGFDEALAQARGAMRRRQRSS